MTHDEMIAVIQHHKNGGKVECKHKDETKWLHASNPWWNFEEYDYRAKPEPLVLWAEISNGISVANWSLIAKFDPTSGGAIKKFMEVAE